MAGLGAKRTEAAERVVGELTKRDRQIAALTFDLAARSGAHSISIVGCKWGIKTLVHMKHVAPPPSTLQQEKGDEPSKGPRIPETQTCRTACHAAVAAAFDGRGATAGVAAGDKGGTAAAAAGRADGGGDTALHGQDGREAQGHRLQGDRPSRRPQRPLGVRQRRGEIPYFLTPLQIPARILGGHFGRRGERGG